MGALIRSLEPRVEAALAAIEKKSGSPCSLRRVPIDMITEAVAAEAAVAHVPDVLAAPDEMIEYIVSRIAARN